MHRAIPVSNRFLSKKWEERNQEVHMEKLRSMRPTVDANSPPVFAHTVKKAKREQLLEERYTEIERENRLLLEKMSSIMSGRPVRTRSVKKRSLNQESRKRELVKISQENQALMRRLQDRQPSYNIQKWEGERKQTERLLQNICEFPYKLGVKTFTVEEGRRRFGSVDSRAEGRTASHRAPGTTDRPRKLVPLSRDSSRNVVFKRGINIRDKYFLVEISQLEGGLSITAFDIENPDSYTLELDLNEALRLMGGEANYERLVALLAFEGEELILIDHPTPVDHPLPAVKKPKPPGRSVKKSPPRERPVARSEEVVVVREKPIEPFADDLGKPSYEALPSAESAVPSVHEGNQGSPHFRQETPKRKGPSPAVKADTESREVPSQLPQPRTELPATAQGLPEDQPKEPTPVLRESPQSASQEEPFLPAVERKEASPVPQQPLPHEELTEEAVHKAPSPSMPHQPETSVRETGVVEAVESREEVTTAPISNPMEPTPAEESKEPASGPSEKPEESAPVELAADPMSEFPPVEEAKDPVESHNPPEEVSAAPREAVSGPEESKHEAEQPAMDFSAPEALPLEQPAERSSPPPESQSVPHEEVAKEAQPSEPPLEQQAEEPNSPIVEPNPPVEEQTLPIEEPTPPTEEPKQPITEEAKPPLEPAEPLIDSTPAAAPQSDPSDRPIASDPLETVNPPTEAPPTAQEEDSQSLEVRAALSSAVPES